MRNTVLFDQTSDKNGQKLHRLFSLYGFPERVKDASSADLIGEADMAPHCYADPAARMLPIHTAEATLVSAAFLLDQSPVPKEGREKKAMDRLNAAAAFHGVRRELIEIEKQAAALHGPAEPVRYDLLPDEDFAIVFETADGKKERHCPLTNEGEVKAAAAYVQKHRDVIPLADRRKFASAILSRADRFGVQLDPDDADRLDRMAGYGTCAIAQAAQAISDRRHLLSRMGEKEAAAELDSWRGELIKHASVARDASPMRKLADVLDQVDRTFNLTRYYDNGLERPEDALFTVTTKSASAFMDGHIQLPTGSVYSLSDLSRVRLDDVRGLMGSDWAEKISSGGIFLSMTKLAAEVTKLDRPAARLFEKLLSETKIEPTDRFHAEKQASSDRFFNRERLSALASLRKR